MTKHDGDLISRSALLEHLRERRQGFVISGDYGLAVKALHFAPAVDAVEVVRCKDCNHRYQYEDWDRQSQEVVVCHECRVLRKDFGDDGFCSYGERRSDDERKID